MFVAQPSFSMPRIAPRTTGSGATPWLIAWAAAGCLVLLLSETARGGAALGASLPFWLVGAPLIDLAWVERTRIRAWLGDQAHRLGRTARRRRNTKASRRKLVPARYPAHR
jgi:hypothetical protein